MTKKEPSEEIMIYQSQYSLLGGGRLEGGSDKERSRMVKGSEMKLIKKWKWSCSLVSDSLGPIDCSWPGSSVHGIFQAIVLEWIAISFSRKKRKQILNILFSHLPPHSPTPHKALWEKGEEMHIFKSPALCWDFEAGIILIFPSDESEA